MTREIRFTVTHRKLPAKCPKCSKGRLQLRIGLVLQGKWNKCAFRFGDPGVNEALCEKVRAFVALDARSSDSSTDTKKLFIERLRAWVDVERQTTPGFWETFRTRGPPKGGKDPTQLSEMQLRATQGRARTHSGFAGKHWKIMETGHSRVKGAMNKEACQVMLQLSEKTLHQTTGSEVHYQIHAGNGTRIMRIHGVDTIANQKAENVKTAIEDKTLQFYIQSKDQVLAQGKHKRWSDEKVQQEVAWHASLLWAYNTIRHDLQIASGLPDLPTCLEVMLSWPGQEWQAWHQDGASRDLLTCIGYLQPDSSTTLFAPVVGCDYRGLMMKGKKEEAMDKLGEAWRSVASDKYLKTVTSKKPRLVQRECLSYGENDLTKIYTPDELKATQVKMQVGDVQFENPYHVHRAPKPPLPGGKPRRTIFAAWDRFCLANASLSVTWHHNWKAVWCDADSIEARAAGSQSSTG